MQVKSLIIAMLSFITILPLSAIEEEGEKLVPAPLVQLDTYFTGRILVAEKSTHKVYVFENDNGTPKLVKSYPVVTGKVTGDKQQQGDFRTPEGIYFFQDFIPKKELLSRYGKEGNIYGIGAFTLDFPNPFDNLKKKTGQGIWLHSTNDETRIEKGLDSRGCVVTNDSNLKELSNYLLMQRTPMIIVHNLSYYKESTLAKTREGIMELMNGWLAAWREKDLKGYLQSYHPDYFIDNVRGRYKKFADYKKAVFLMPGKPTIDLGNISILLSEHGYATVTFKQKYHSNTVNDVGAKTLYLMKDEFYTWKIVFEKWHSLPENEKEFSSAIPIPKPYFKNQ